MKKSNFASPGAREVSQLCGQGGREGGREGEGGLVWTYFPFLRVRRENCLL